MLPPAAGRHIVITLRAEAHIALALEFLGSCLQTVRLQLLAMAAVAATRGRIAAIGKEML